LVSDGVGPDLEILGLSAGTGISVTDVGTSLQITNTSPASSVTLTNLGNFDIANDTTGPSMTLRGLTAGTGIGMSQGANNITVTNNSPASSVSLSNAGGGTTLVADGSGPTLGIRSISAGTNVSFNVGAQNIQINSSSSSEPSYSFGVQYLSNFATSVGVPSFTTISLSNTSFYLIGGTSTGSVTTSTFSGSGLFTRLNAGEIRFDNTGSTTNYNLSGNVTFNSTGITPVLGVRRMTSAGAASPLPDDDGSGIGSTVLAASFAANANTNTLHFADTLTTANNYYFYGVYVKNFAGAGNVNLYQFSLNFHLTPV
jgi:hypothetical protein